MMMPIHPISNGKDEMPAGKLSEIEVGSLNTHTVKTSLGKRKLSSTDEKCSTADEVDSLAQKTPKSHHSSSSSSSQCSSSLSLTGEEQGVRMKAQKLLMAKVLRSFMPTARALRAGMDAIVQSRTSVIFPLCDSSQKVYIKPPAVFKSSTPRATEEEFLVQQIMNILGPELFVSAFRFTDLNTARFKVSALRERAVTSGIKNLGFVISTNTTERDQLEDSLSTRLNARDKSLYNKIRSKTRSSSSQEKENLHENLYFIPKYDLYNKKYADRGKYKDYLQLQNEIFCYQNSPRSLWAEGTFKELQELWLRRGIHVGTLIIKVKKTGDTQNTSQAKSVPDKSQVKVLSSIRYLSDALNIKWKLIVPEIYNEEISSFENVSSKLFFDKMRTFNQINEKNPDDLKFFATRIDPQSQLALLNTGICQFFDLVSQNIGLELTVDFSTFHDFVNSRFMYSTEDKQGNIFFKKRSGRDLFEKYKKGRITDKTLFIIKRDDITDNSSLLPIFTLDIKKIYKKYEEYKSFEFSYLNERNVDLDQLNKDFKDGKIDSDTYVSFVNSRVCFERTKIGDLIYLTKILSLDSITYDGLTHAIFQFDKQKKVASIAIPLKYYKECYDVLNFQAKLNFYDLERCLDRSNYFILCDGDLVIPYYANFLNLEAKDMPLSAEIIEEFCRTDRWEQLNEWIWRSDSFIRQFLPKDPDVQSRLNEKLKTLLAKPEYSIAHFRKSKRGATIEDVRSKFAEDLANLAIPEHLELWQEVQKQLEVDVKRGWFTIKDRPSLLQEGSANALAQRIRIAKELFPRLTYEQITALNERHANSLRYITNYKNLIDLKIPNPVTIDHLMTLPDSENSNAEENEEYVVPTQDLIKFCTTVGDYINDVCTPYNSLDRKLLRENLQLTREMITKLPKLKKTPSKMQQNKSSDMNLSNEISELNANSREEKKVIKLITRCRNLAVSIYHDLIDATEPSILNVIQSMFPLLADFNKLYELIIEDSDEPLHRIHRTAPIDTLLEEARICREAKIKQNPQDPSIIEYNHLIDLFEKEIDKYYNPLVTITVEKPVDKTSESLSEEDSDVSTRFSSDEDGSSSSSAED